jgi:hypothetical protein
MIPLRLKTSLYILVSGFILGFFIALFFLPVKACPDSKKHASATTKQLNKQASVIEKEYQAWIASLQDQNAKLQSGLCYTQSLLDQAKQTAKQKENRIKINLDTKKVQKKALALDSYTIPLFDCPPDNCDSLKNEITEYINENHRKDSLYETQISQLDSVVWIKDSIIHVNEGLHNSFREVFDKTIAGHKALQEENRLLRKKEKRRKRKSRLITAGLLIVSGSVINQFIRH